MSYTLITGASSGIGYKLAELFAQNNKSLILVARDKSRLQNIKQSFEKKFKVEVICLSLDLTNDNDVDYLFKYVEENNLIVDNLINNAGIGSFGNFNEIDKDIDMDLIRLNVYTPTKLMKLFLPKFIERNSGGILNVSSTAAFGIGPGMATYYATKSYLLQLSESISYELKGTNVTVSTFCPGPVDTDFQRKAGVKKSSISKGYIISAEEAAKSAYEGFIKGKVIIVPGIKNKLLVQGFRFLPRCIIGNIASRLNKR